MSALADRRAARAATHSDCFRDPYAQDTLFAAANRPLLSQLFGGTPDPASHQHKRVSYQDDDMGSHITDRFTRTWSPKPVRGDRFVFVSDKARDAYEDEEAPSLPPDELVFDVPQPVSRAERVERVQRWQRELDEQKSQTDQYATLDARVPATHALDDAARKEEDARIQQRRAAAEESAEVPFYLQVRETKKRVDEQLEVHRGLNEAFSQLTMVQKQAERNRSEARLNAVLSSLRERQDAAWARVFPGGFPDEASSTVAATTPTLLTPPVRASTPAASPVGNAPGASRTKTAAAAAPVAVNNPLKDILESFSRPRTTDRAGGRGTTPPPPPAPPKKTLPADVVKAPVEPVAYPAYRYVLRVNPNEGNDDYASDFTGTDEGGTNTSAVTSETGISGSNEPTITESVVSESIASSPAALASGADDTDSSIHSSAPQSDSGVDTDSVPVSASYASDSFIEDDVTVAESGAAASDTGASSTIVSESVLDTDETQRRGRGDGSLAKQAAKLSNTALVTTLREFYDACRHANRIASALMDGGSTAMLPARPPHRHNAGSETRSEAGDAADPLGTAADSDAHWQELLEKDATDVHRLRRFVDRLQKNIHAVDLQRKVAASRRKLLREAQALAKTRSRLKQQRHAVLEDVIDSEVEAYFGKHKRGARSDKKTRPRRRSGATSDDEILSDVASEDFLFQSENGSVLPGSDDDDIVDEFEFEQSSAKSEDSVEDAIEDEWEISDSQLTGDTVPSDIPDMAEDVYEDDEVFDALGQDSEDGVLDEVESELASQLAAVSDPEEVADMLEELPDSPEDYHQRLPVRRGSDSVDEDVEDEVGGLDMPSPPGQQGLRRAVLELESVSALSHSSDGDVSSLYPDSLARSDEDHAESSIDSVEAAYWESVAGEEALQAMEAALRETKRRRLRALKTIGSEAPTFSALYDPTVAPPPVACAVELADDETMASLESTTSTRSAVVAVGTETAKEVEEGHKGAGPSDSEEPLVSLFAEESEPLTSRRQVQHPTQTLRALLVEEPMVPVSLEVMPVPENTVATGRTSDAAAAPSPSHSHRSSASDDTEDVDSRLSDSSSESSASSPSASLSSSFSSFHSS